MRALIGLSLILTTPALADTALRVRALTRVATGRAVTLADVVEGEGLGEEARQKLRGVVIAPDLSVGERRVLASQTVLRNLREIIEAERARQKIALSVPPVIELEAGLRALSEDAVRRELLTAWQNLCRECQLSIDNLNLPQVRNVAAWSLRPTGELPRGSFSVAIELTRADGVRVPAFVGGRLVAKKQVPVARRQLNIGERVAPDDLKLEYRDLANAFDGVPNTADLAGMHLRQGVRAGEVLFSGFLEKEKAIHRGELVQVKTGAKNWEVSVNLVAGADAAIGDWITLKNPKGNTSLEGRVSAPGEVVLK